MFEHGLGNDDIFRWFATKSRPKTQHEEPNVELLNKLSETCLLVPGLHDTQVWYHPGSTSFYYAKTSSLVACAHDKLFGSSDGSLAQKSAGQSDEHCKATLTFSGKKEIKHNHPCFGKEQAQHLCYNWAVNLLSCTVGNSSWLAVGVGYLSSLWPEGVAALRNTAEQPSPIDFAILTTQKRNADDKRRYRATFSIEKFLRFSSAIKESSAFEHVTVEDVNRWESICHIVHELVKGALEWEPVLHIDKQEGVMPLSPPATLLSEPLPDTPLTDNEGSTHRSQSPSGSVEGAQLSDNSASSTLQKKGDSSNVDSKAAGSPTRVQEPPVRSSVKKLCASSCDEIEVDHSFTEKTPVDGKARKRRGRSCSRPKSAAYRRPRSLNSRSASKTPIQHAREMSPVPLGSLHGVPDVMSPIVVLTRLPSGSLEKLNKQNGMISMQELNGDFAGTIEKSTEPKRTLSVGGSVNGKSKPDQGMSGGQRKRRRNRCVAEFFSEDDIAKNGEKKRRYRTRSTSISSTGTVSVISSEDNVQSETSLDLAIHEEFPHSETYPKSVE